VRTLGIGGVGIRRRREARCYHSAEGWIQWTTHGSMCGSLNVIIIVSQVLVGWMGDINEVAGRR
jgi:hypothetical protein